MPKKDEIVCPNCKEQEDIKIDAYVEHKFCDIEEIGIECICQKCKEHFYFGKEDE